MNWSQRINKSAKHFLGALMFYESAVDAQSKSESTLLAATGAYYTGFHLGVALLWLCEDVEPEDLHRLRHDRLRHLISQHAVQSNLLTQAFLDDLAALQEFREYANYQICNLIRDSRMPNELDTLLPKCEPMIKAVGESIGSLLPGLEEAANLHLPFQIGIGDGFGDDVIRGQVGPEIYERVVQRLVDLELTT